MTRMVCPVTSHTPRDLPPLSLKFESRTIGLLGTDATSNAHFIAALLESQCAVGPAVGAALIRVDRTSASRLVAVHPAACPGAATRCSRGVGSPPCSLA